MSDEEVEALVRKLRVVATYFIGDDIVSRITSAIVVRAYSIGAANTATFSGLLT